jgi:hypothetical protein
MWRPPRPDASRASRRPSPAAPRGAPPRTPCARHPANRHAARGSSPHAPSCTGCWPLDLASARIDLERARARCGGGAGRSGPSMCRGLLSGRRGPATEVFARALRRRAGRRDRSCRAAAFLDTLTERNASQGWPPTANDTVTVCAAQTRTHTPIYLLPGGGQLRTRRRTADRAVQGRARTASVRGGRNYP